jgi:prephenate dehydrogenase
MVVGTGLIGGSVGMALRANGWHVTGRDDDILRAARALELGAIDAVGDDPSAELTVIATPVGAIAVEAQAALERPGVVTDVGGTKSGVVAAVDDPRFVGGHPMAGSEQEGVEGADAELFAGAVWVLTPTSETDPTAHALVRSFVTSLGADVVELSPERHDELVALVSHVPHLTAATLMTLAAERAEEHQALLRLAAGGFRDMTRIASGHPGIWPDIAAENRDAIVDALDRLIAALHETRTRVAETDRVGLFDMLESARGARLNLPPRGVEPDLLVELRVPVPDRPGVLAEITTLASDLGVNIVDLEIAHSTEGVAGVIIMTIEQKLADLFRGGLMAKRYRPAPPRSLS